MTSYFKQFFNTNIVNRYKIMETHSNTTKEGPCRLKKMMFATIVMSPSILVGMNLLFPVIAIPQMNLMLRDTVLFEMSMTIGALTGYFLNWFIIEKLGRRPALLFSILPNLIGWPLLFYHRNLITTFVGVFFNGLSVGAVGYCTLVYYRECIKTNRLTLRDDLFLRIGFCIFFGMILVLSLDFFLDYGLTSAVATILASISFLLICFFIPESPTWLKKQDKDIDVEVMEEQPGMSEQPITDDDDSSAVRKKRSDEAFAAETLNIVKENSTQPFHMLLMLILLLIFSFCTSAFSYLVKDIDKNSDKIVGILFNRTSEAKNSTSTDINFNSGISAVLNDTLILCVVVIIMKGVRTALKSTKISK